MYTLAVGRITTSRKQPNAVDSKQNGLFYWQVGKVDVKLERKIQLKFLVT